MTQPGKSCEELIRQGLSERGICSALRMSPNTVTKIRSGDYHPRRCGRPSLLSDEHVRFIEANSLADARLTDNEMALMVKNRFDLPVSRPTICRIRQRLGFVFRPPMVIQELTDDQIRSRIEFCRWVIENEKELPNVVFTDESRFQRGADNQWRRIRRGQWNESCFTTKEKFPVTVMVWGGIGVNYRSPLIQCSKSVNSAEYQEILERSDMFGEMDARYGRGNWTLMQDGAPCHLSRATLNWLDEKHVCTVPGWPPNSPDLNPIEQVWGIMKVLLRKQPPQTNTELYSRLCEVWSSISEEQINKMVSSFTERCRMVLAVNGRSISQYLSSHRYVPLVEMPATVWCDDADDQLLRLVQKHGHRWQYIGNMLHVAPMTAKNRYNFLNRKQANMHHRNSVPLPPITDLELPTELADLLAVRIPDHPMAQGAAARDQNGISF